eukprot:TRINITY_DN11831_c0_g1_i1.p1 TRINITY_DN11831_c0_g1~~TRINITY_DN11831_c0_g1_i1.p1  ORF type:complete len:558 (+),score=78.03 TRINITY_DN11831_c0_g1_i1:48-1721(+)
METRDSDQKGGFNLVNSLLFPSPESTYMADTFPCDELIWLPRSLDPENLDPQSDVPCTFLTFSSARFIMLYFHSNAEDLGRCRQFCNMLRMQFQVNVLAVEYPGYGLCPGGQADEDSVVANALLGYRFITQVLNFQPEDIIVIGRSIGSGPALYIGAQYPVYGVILICPFLSVKEVVRNHLGRLADLIQERFPNMDRVKQITASLLVVHGKKDNVIPCEHGEALYEACSRRKLLVTPNDMNHNSNLLSDPGAFVVPVLQFFRLPDYSFESMIVPSWVFDRQHAPTMQSDATLAGEDGFASDLAGRLFPFSNSASYSPDKAGVRMRVGLREGIQPSFEFEYQNVNDARPPPELLETSDSGVQDMADAAIDKYLAYRRRYAFAKDATCNENAVQDESPRIDNDDEEVLRAVVLDGLLGDKSRLCPSEEPPSPPDDAGFFKVPRSQNAGPTLTAPVHLPQNTEPQQLGGQIACEWGPSWMLALCSTGTRNPGLPVQEVVTVTARPQEQAAISQHWATSSKGLQSSPGGHARRGSTERIVSISPLEQIFAVDPRVMLETRF